MKSLAINEKGEVALPLRYTDGAECRLSRVQIALSTQLGTWISDVGLGLPWEQALETLDFTTWTSRIQQQAARIEGAFPRKCTAERNNGNYIFTLLLDVRECDRIVAAQLQLQVDTRATPWAYGVTVQRLT